MLRFKEFSIKSEVELFKPGETYRQGEQLFDRCY